MTGKSIGQHFYPSGLAQSLGFSSDSRKFAFTAMKDSADLFCILEQQVLYAGSPRILWDKCSCPIISPDFKRWFDVGNSKVSLSLKGSVPIFTDSETVWAAIFSANSKYLAILTLGTLSFWDQKSCNAVHPGVFPGTILRHIR